MSNMRERFIGTVTELDLSPPQAHALKVLRPELGASLGPERFLQAGRIRLVNADVADLYERVPVGTKVIIRQKPEL